MLTTVSVVLTGMAAPAASAEENSGWKTGTAPAGSEGHWVTLLTGDRVYVEGNQIGITPAAGREHIGFSQYEKDGHQYVVPNDAMRMVSEGQVDRRLFDVTGLVKAGYHDEAVGELPVIVQQSNAAKHLRATAQVSRSLPSIGAEALRVPKNSSAEFWSGLTTGSQVSRRAAEGVTKIWLDGAREVSLDVSVPQIGAPAAWAAGHDGTGVTVAVLDTGIDATHPDLKGKIVEAKNFTEAPDTDDTVGHGTHVASTVAGSGAASGGKFRGVAPGASLLIGKVCPTRNCSDSAILAGMEWAAPRARVINLSLGAPDSPGIDPVEEAVNSLTAQTGALFVVAAGNEGADSNVGSPATADAALAVGAVDKQDNLAPFSNRGPRVDGAIKPDITAPGVGIVAALAAHSGYPPASTPGYTQLNGTSMATPHVAGAAALLAQQHPKWVAGDLKATLMGSAKPNPALNVFAQGAGRVDVARAINTTVQPGPVSLALGSQPWPAEDDVPIVKTVTYRNTGTAAVTLDLSTQVTAPDGKPVPAGMFTANPSRITVPANGSADVTLTTDTRVPSATGVFTGALIATGDQSVRVPLTVTKGHESRTLTIRHINRDGTAASTYETSVVGVDHQIYQVPFNESGTVSVRVRPGRYHIESKIVSPDGSSTLLVQPSFTVAGDSQLELDARKGTSVSVTVPRASARTRLASAGFLRTLPSGYQTSPRIIGDSFAKLFTADLGGEVTPDQGRIISEVRSVWAEPTPDGTFFDSPYEYDLVWFQRGKFLTNFKRAAKPQELATVTDKYYAVSPEKKQGFSHNWGFPPEGGSALSAPIRFTVPGTRTIYVTAADTTWRRRWEQIGPQSQYWTNDITYKPGHRYEAQWQRAVIGPRFGERTYMARTGNTMFFNLPPFGDQAGTTGYSLLDSGRMAFYRDGTKLVEVPTYFYDSQGPVPAATSTYRLEYEVNRRTGFDVGTQISGSWTFKSGEVGTDKPTYMPLAGVSFAPHTDIGNSVPGGLIYPLPVSLQRYPGSASPKVREINIEASFDEGTTWRKVLILPTGRDSWVALMAHPWKGTVSLRASATFADGSAVDYTALRAYKLRSF
ncbi:subtilisin family serine protease [Kibdelosporangium banguiense]|uniref:Subtilisin family serine protease n=1 Tax=Kibdelosporangium banguiense TaxID=1365924 RepID=A0ABS4U1D1_9PSEU|nr:S8 family serine peptidase [Kibdelosporangium banguiense]MBP2330445.1 subtilisin family serine protease [Kibdelosporangium banguiense]